MSRSNLAQHAEEMLYADETLECGGLGNGKRNKLDGTSPNHKGAVRASRKRAALTNITNTSSSRGRQLAAAAQAKVRRMVNRPVPLLLLPSESVRIVADLLPHNRRLATTREATSLTRNSCEALRNVHRPKNVHSPIGDLFPP
mmetsp:Transcript_1082/g.6971  ORF Transcript_1082/g.6971 Transcript_1082/m.6971 type:complete len:143 (+) Transcript_1082:224-652(+)